MEIKMEKDKSGVVVRTVVFQNGKEIIVEETIDNINESESIVSNEKLNELFDSIYPNAAEK